MCLNQRRLVGQIIAGGGCVRVGDCLKYLKRAWNRKQGRGDKDLKKGGGQAGSKSGCLNRGGWNPRTNYDKLAKM